LGKRVELGRYFLVGGKRRKTMVVAERGFPATGGTGGETDQIFGKKKSAFQYCVQEDEAKESLPGTQGRAVDLRPNNFQYIEGDEQ